MNTPEIFESEYKFCLILWEHEPITATALVKICSEKLGWNKSTTYTVIRRLTERCVIQFTASVVTSIVKKDEAQIAKIDEVIDKTFEGSLPSFIAAFASSKRLSKEEADTVMKLIESYRG